MSIRIDGTNTTANPGITGSDTDTGLQFGTNEVKVVTGGSDRVTVDSAGRVGIAATPEAWDGFDALEVNEASIVSSGSGDAFFTANAYYDGAWKYKDAGVARNVYMNSDGIVFRTAPSGSADGTITWTEVGRWREGGGLTFNGDTAAANALNDYEEGTFTPVWQTTGTAFSSVTYTNQVGYYTKIGNLVHVSLRLKSTASSGGSGYLLIGGLPFQIDDDTGAGGGSPSTYFIDYHNSTINVATETRDNTSQFYLLSSLDNASWQNVSSGGLQGSGSSEVRVSFAYQTDS